MGIEVLQNDSGTGTAVDFSNNVGQVLGTVGNTTATSATLGYSFLLARPKVTQTSTPQAGLVQTTFTVLIAPV